ncbi:MAG: hypothetical protein WCH93_00670 [Actinomycetota bacterium]
MKKSIAVVLAGSSVFAFAAAAASTLTVTGVKDPKAGSQAAVTCDVGTVTVTPVHDGTKLNALTVTTGTVGSAGCAGFTIYTKVAVTGTSAPTSGFLFINNLTANVDRTAGTTLALDATTGLVFATFASGTPATKVAAPNLTDITLGTVSVVVAATAPTGDSEAGPATGWGA